jgi:DNA invertase Pin-like site-specific DNA recombinase
MYMKAAIYARVSTNNQGQDVTMQTRELQKYAEARGWSITGEYLDRGVSGAKDRRPELDRLMTDAKRRKFDAIQKQPCYYSKPLFYSKKRQRGV